MMMTPSSEPPAIDTTGPEAILPIPFWGRMTMLIAPVVLFFIVALFIHFLWGWGHAAFFLANGFGNFIGAGKLVILTGALPGAPINAWGIAALVVYSDIAVSMMLLALMHVIYRLPLIGPVFSQTRVKGWRILKKHPWIRRAAFFGIALFIAMPFQGTGAVLGTILARMTGLSRRSTLLAVCGGSSLGCAAIAFLAELNQNRLAQLAQQPILGIVLAGAVLAAMYLIGKRLAG